MLSQYQNKRQFRDLVVIFSMGELITYEAGQWRNSLRLDTFRISVSSSLSLNMN
jgi:hypothetical protein